MQNYGNTAGIVSLRSGVSRSAWHVVRVPLSWKRRKLLCTNHLDMVEPRNTFWIRKLRRLLERALHEHQAALGLFADELIVLAEVALDGVELISD
jgi:hypothetical protein